MHTASIALIGSGAVAHTLGRALAAAGAPIAAVASRSPSRAAETAAFIGPAVAAVAIQDLPRSTSRIIIATRDDSITAVAETLADAGMRGGIALHTCGSQGPQSLAPLAERSVACGVMHPMQTIVHPARAPRPFDGITFGVAGSPPALAWATELAMLAGGRALPVDGDRMSIYHAASVLAGNAVAALVDAASALMQAAGIEEAAARSALEPLTRTAVDNVFRLGPAAAATGPIVRGDAATVERHLAALHTERPDLEPLYREVSRRLVHLARARGLDAAAVAALERLLDASNPGDLS